MRRLFAAIALWVAMTAAPAMAQEVITSQSGNINGTEQTTGLVPMRQMPAAPALDRIQAVKVSTRSLVNEAPIFSYERMIKPKRSVELGFGFHGLAQYETNYPKGFQLKAGYKFMLPVGEEHRATAAKGQISSGFYIKPELNYVYYQRRYDCYTGNHGWQMDFEEVTRRDNNLAMLFVGGYQYAWAHVTLEHFIGIGRYWSTGGLPQVFRYGFAALGDDTHGTALTAGWKLGFVF